MERVNWDFTISTSHCFIHHWSNIRCILFSRVERWEIYAIEGTNITFKVHRFVLPKFTLGIGQCLLPIWTFVDHWTSGTDPQRMSQNRISHPKVHTNFAIMDCAIIQISIFSGNKVCVDLNVSSWSKVGSKRGLSAFVVLLRYKHNNFEFMKPSTRSATWEWQHRHSNFSMIEHYLPWTPLFKRTATVIGK